MKYSPLRAEMRGEIQSLRAEMRGEIQLLRSEILTEIRRSEERILTALAHHSHVSPDAGPPVFWQPIGSANPVSPPPSEAPAAATIRALTLRMRNTGAGFKPAPADCQYPTACPSPRGSDAPASTPRRRSRTISCTTPW